MTGASELGKTINERRLSLHYSIGQLANVVGVTASEVRAWENGETIPDGPTRAKLADALEVKKSQLEKAVPKDPPSQKETTAPDATSVVAAAVAGKAKAKSQPVADEPKGDLDPGETGAAVEPTPAPSAEKKPQPSKVAPPADAPAAVDLEREQSPAAASDKAELVDLPTERIPIIKDAPPPPERQAATSTSSAASASASAAAMSAVAVTAPPAPPRPTSTTSASPAIVTPWRQTLETVFDRDKPWLFWIRTALLVIGLLILLRILAWAVPEFFTTLGEILDTVQSTTPDPELQDPIPLNP